jgi:REP element-mobilizing transposase RayT
VPGGCYHVILRGNHQEILFGNSSDQIALNGIVCEVITRLEARVHAFCWMTNHLHALVQIADRPLGDVMKSIAMRYSRYRHRKMRTTGHLFERRYKAKLVQIDAYFLVLLRYIHLNPVKAQIVADPADFPWSSHRTYLGKEFIPWLTTDLGLSLFGSDLKRARAAYARFVLQSHQIGEIEVNANPDDPRVLGTAEFIQQIPARRLQPKSRCTLDQLAERVCANHGIPVDVMRSPARARYLTPLRIDFAQEVLQQRIGTLTDVARYLNRDPSALTKLLQVNRCRT